MMARRRKLAMLCALAFAATCEVAHAEPVRTAEAQAAPPYTLDVDSDVLDVVSFEALAARLGAELGAPVVRPTGTAPSSAAITIRYRARELVVRAVHAGGRVLERTVQAEGDDAAVQREAVLLAGNLARDEARELLDALAKRPSPPPPAPPVAAPPPEPAPKAPVVDEGRQPVSVAFFFPLATNFAHPNATSNLNLSLLYGRVGAALGTQLGSGVVHASRRVSGVQLGAFGSWARGSVKGVQLGGAGNIALDGVSGAQLSGGLNLARGPVTGALLTGGVNIATGDMAGGEVAPVNVGNAIDGFQLGVINVAKKVRGAQLGVINVAEEVEGASVGLISITRGGIHPIAWTSNLQHLNAGVKFSTKYVYTLGAVHTGTIEGDFQNVGITGALGGHIPLPMHFDIEIQGAVSHLVPRPSQSSKNGNLWMTEQVMAGYSLATHFRVFAGGGVRHGLSVDLGRDVVRPEVLAGVQF